MWVLAAKLAVLVFVSANLFSAEDVDMPNPILGVATVSDDFYQRIGRSPWNGLGSNAYALTCWPISALRTPVPCT